jgi:uncharacterized Tic20 family protein
MQPQLTAEERNWAAIAHASILLSMLVGIATAGIGSLLLALIPLGIYGAYREKSRYVAYHALQATVFQLAGLIVYVLGLILLIVLTVLAWAVAGVLTVVLVGVLLMPVAVAVTVVLVLFALAFPLALTGYGLYAAVETGQGRPFRYAIIGEWLEETEASWMRGPR